MWPNPQKTADLITFTEEILNGKFDFLCSEISYIVFHFISKRFGLFSNNEKLEQSCFYLHIPRRMLFHSLKPLGNQNIIEFTKYILWDKITSTKHEITKLYLNILGGEWFFKNKSRHTKITIASVAALTSSRQPNCLSSKVSVAGVL